MRCGMVTGVIIVALVLLAVRRALDVVEVRGGSMAPTLLPGDRLVAIRLRRAARVGDVVLAQDPRDPTRELVKRVTHRDRSSLYLRGDNPAASTDARTFGAVTDADVRWRAALRYWPIGRIGRLPRRPGSEEEIDQGGEPACTVPEALVVGG
jgi:nickel-type superoxide dismutase maturation protease